MEADRSDSGENGRGQAWEKVNTQHFREFCCEGEQKWERQPLEGMGGSTIIFKVGERISHVCIEIRNADEAEDRGRMLGGCLEKESGQGGGVA